MALKMNHIPVVNIAIVPEPFEPQSVQYTINPGAGLAIAFISVKVIRGGKNPLSVDFTSSIADESGWLLSILMPTWAKTLIAESKNRVKIAMGFFIVKKLIVSGLIRFSLG